MNKDYCPECCLQTNHDILFTEKIISDPSDDFHWSIQFEVIRCKGCDNIQFRHIYGDESMFDGDENGGIVYYDERKYFPGSIIGHSGIKNFYEIPTKIRIVYLETLEALKANCYLLAAVGLRAVIEAVSIDQKIAGKNLEQKINNLSKNRLITDNDANRLHGIRFLGNDSVHEMEVPNEAKLSIALNIVEHLINNLYLIDIEANKHLDTVISNYEDFKNLLLRKLFKISKGTELSIKEILEKDFRRIETSYIANFTQQLVEEINKNTFNILSVGKIKISSIENSPVQHFVKNDSRY
jgi:hypothetical protein